MLGKFGVQYIEPKWLFGAGSGSGVVAVKWQGGGGDGGDLSCAGKVSACNGLHVDPSLGGATIDRLAKWPRK